MIAWWLAAAAANALITLVYFGIAAIIGRGLLAGRQWRANPLGVATFAIFFSCAGGHALHLIHVLPPFTATSPAQAAAGQAVFGDWRLIAWDAFTASIAIWYWAIRSRVQMVYEGASLCEDMAARQRQATLLQKKIVEGLAAAQVSLDAGRRAEGLATLDRTLEESKGIIAMLAGGKSSRRVAPGDLRREQAL